MAPEEYESQSRLVWMIIHDTPVCPYCMSVFTYKYILREHGYGCTDCSKDFGNVIKLR